MKSKDFLRSKGIVSPDAHHFIIDFPDGREINLAELLEEYAHQSGPSEDKIIDAHLAGQANAGCKHPSYSEARAYLITLESSPVVSSGEGMAEALTAEQIKQLADDYFSTTKWLDAKQEQDTKFGFRIGVNYALSNLSPAGDDGRGPEERRSDALEWWDKVDKVDRFAMLKKYGYQDEKKPWKYRPLTDKGIYLMWCRENGG